MKINAISRGSGQQSSDALRQLALAAFYQSFPLAPFAEFYSHRGNADTPRKIDSQFTAGTTRALAGAFTAQGRTPQFGSTSLKIYGDSVKTDRAYERRGYDIGSQRAKDLRDFASSLGRFFMDACVNHDGTTLSGNAIIKGMKQLAEDNSRSTVFGSGSDGAELPSGNGNSERKAQDAFIEQLNAIIADIAGGPDVLVMNGAMLSRLQSIGRGYMSVQNATDVFLGKQFTQFSFNGVPILNAGYAANNSGLIITSTETQGGAVSNCTSIYAAKFGEEQDLTFATNVGIDCQDLGAVESQFITLLEFDVDSALLNTKALARLKGIIL